MHKDYLFIPHVSVGKFKFGENINKYTDGIDYIYTKAEEEWDWHQYELASPRISIYVDDDKIVSIACRDKCMLFGSNIIGMTMTDFIALINAYPDLDQTDTVYTEDENRRKDKPQIVYEFDNFGIQAWVKNGIIVTAFCSPYESDDESVVPSRDNKN